MEQPAVPLALRYQWGEGIAGDLVRYDTGMVARHFLGFGPRSDEWSSFIGGFDSGRPGVASMRPPGRYGRWYDLGVEIHQWVLAQGLPHGCTRAEGWTPPGVKGEGGKDD